MKHLIIGAADNYTWNDIRIWATSLGRVGFSGDIVLIAYRVAQDVLDKCLDLGITVIRPEEDEMGNPINYNTTLPTPSHKLRNFHAWQYLSEIDDEKYEIVAINDVRDVVYQENPDRFFRTIINDTLDELIWMPSENVLFKNELWNANMVQSLFGPYMLALLLDRPTCNSGTFFGTYLGMKSFLLKMYMVERTFQVTGADQPTMNVLGYLATVTAGIIPHNVGYACQCGTTLDPTKYFPQISPAPIVDAAGFVYTDTGDKFILVHQYDRVPQLKQAVESRFA